MNNVIKLSHGDGGKHTEELIKNIFYKYFNNDLLVKGQDATIFQAANNKLAFTTDSFVVKPVFFSGGNIGKLAVCGTINDLIVSGASPLYLSAGFIIEEGFSLENLNKIVKSMSETCLESGVSIITGDTKVVEKGKVDGIFINTSGIGIVLERYKQKPIKDGDKIIVTGNIGDHGTTIAIERYDIKVKDKIKSDCASLYPFTEIIKDNYDSIKIMRDPTRGGLATVLHEFSNLCELGIHLMEEDIPIDRGVIAVNELLGFDPLYMACEGRMVIVVEESEAENILKKIQEFNGGKNAKIIGEFIKESRNTIFIENYFGGKRILPPLEGNMLPRIC
ncbi:hydrogenase expression/formation protein HypE [Clostridium sp. C8]|uniref:hydrogenase expression/formation protein HypE n=1 Tax=Clostridium sp. C8 TaxID=1667357 RepID=UPI00062E7545|nr:hydrogenase expression/formation protein HypE [Clostridium sp. C8]KLE17497.1 carbamoyl dehydratase HypE [Clostridium sp. C8]